MYRIMKSIPSLSGHGHGQRQHATTSAKMISLPILVALSNVGLSSALALSFSSMGAADWLRRPIQSNARIESSLGCWHANSNNFISGAMPAKSSAATTTITRNRTTRLAAATSASSDSASLNHKIKEVVGGYGNGNSIRGGFHRSHPLRRTSNIIISSVFRRGEFTGSTTKKTAFNDNNNSNMMSKRIVEQPLRSPEQQPQQQQPSQKQQRRRRMLPRGIICAFATLLVSHTIIAPLLLTINNNFLRQFLLPLAHAGGGGMAKRNPDATPLTPLSTNELASKLTIWLAIFTGLALLHAAEIAITTLYPWKVREFAEEEEKQRSNSSGGGGGGLGGAGSKGRRQRRGTFQTLNEDITRVLTTILVTSTACSIYATTLFTHLADHIFGTARAEKWSAIFLTAITLFFVELLPKNIGVINAERVARLMVPPINVLANAVGPFGYALSYLAKATLRLFGIKSNETSGVSDSELRLIVTGARDSGTIDYSEQEMIKGVLNLQDQKVREIMKPRVEIVAVPKSMSVASVLGVVRESGYSRIPVYVGEIDNIVGIVLAKSVLDFFVKGVLVDGEYRRPRDDVMSEEAAAGGGGGGGGEGGEQGSTTDDIGKLSFIDPPTGKTMDRYVRSLTGSQLASRMETTIDDAGLIESCYFVPETANGWSVLQEMRRRRVHMAVVVDEYGGTEGLVSLEDIVEEVC